MATSCQIRHTAIRFKRKPCTQRCSWQGLCLPPGAYRGYWDKRGMGIILGVHALPTASVLGVSSHLQRSNFSKLFQTQSLFLSRSFQSQSFFSKSVVLSQSFLENHSLFLGLAFS